MRFLAVIAALLSISPHAGAAVWVAAVDPYAQRMNPTGTKFMELFRPSAAWDVAAANTQVFKVSTQFLDGASDDEISAVVRELRRRHIDLGMEGLLLVESKRCGRGVESYGGAGAIERLTARLMRLGGSIKYVAMDEPLWFGNLATGPRNCNDTIKGLAQQLASNVHTLKAAFPDIKFGDIEPLNNRSVGRIDIILQFARAFKAATGQPLSFVDADIIWYDNWRPQLVEWKAKLHAAGLRFGVIFNGSQNDATDAAWTDHALERYRTVMADPAMRPDDAILQTWMLRPTRLLPDSDPTTLTGLVRQATTLSVLNSR